MPFGAVRLIVPFTSTISSIISGASGTIPCRWKNCISFTSASARSAIRSTTTSSPSRASRSQRVPGEKQAPVPGIGLPCGQRVGRPRAFQSCFSVSSVSACCQRSASPCTRDQSKPR